MSAPPDPKMRRAASAKVTPKIAKSEQQERTDTIPLDVQVFIVALLPLGLPFLCVLASCGGSR
jgi:hypothetical protein